MNKKNNWQEFKAVLDEHRITKLYHFTDRDNLESIIKNGGLYSWGDSEDKGIKIAKPGGGLLSRELDAKDQASALCPCELYPPASNDVCCHAGWTFIESCYFGNRS